MFTVSITVDDYDFDTPEDAARAMLAWLREDNTDVFVAVTDDESHEQTIVIVEAH